MLLKHFILNNIQGSYTDNTMWNDTAPDKYNIYILVQVHLQMEMELNT